MMKKKALEAFLEELRDKFGDRIEEIIVFGSYARGDYDEESDIDVLIVGNVLFDDVVDISTKVLLKYGELISPIVISPEEFRRRNDSFIRTVKREGIKV
ncbi:nucleotidyltransferase domain-containing protein [Thermococcus sp. SY098]|uniref:nucleotidyltransferase domain-containing protein n=1 Tax=Thermococcus sp. SY098 TaxID=3111325 RepID=UPI002D7A0ABD|nr:nucleotidyltransferase domain-containing protein [Thermococcus sp. SY098]WRS52467.1 nucleotidyltransferase domain-containing protein [Thermococcus sp. SY098]